MEMLFIRLQFSFFWNVKRKKKKKRRRKKKELQHSCFLIPDLVKMDFKNRYDIICCVLRYIKNYVSTRIALYKEQIYYWCSGRKIVHTSIFEIALYSSKFVTIRKRKLNRSMKLPFNSLQCSLIKFWKLSINQFSDAQLSVTNFY